MNAQQLRNSILQMAIQGKLVPQNPNDEPASVLLERIRKEKEQLVKEGKLKKKDLVTTPIAEEDIPFNIPESWKWVHLGEIFAHNNGKQLNRADNQGEYHKYITTSNVYWDRFDLKEVRQMLFTEEELKKCTATKGDLLVCEGGDVGRSAIWNFDYDICIQNHIHRVRAYYPLCTRYFLYILMFNKSIGLIGGKGIGIQGFSATALHNTLIALPPLAEQKRIVAKLEELLPLVEQYGKAQDHLDALNADLPRRLRQSILQEAIQGKLVPQDEKDGIAEDLVKTLISAKQSYEQKKKTFGLPIEEVEYPFEIPDTWSWLRLGDIVYNQTGLSYKKEDLEKKVSNPIRVLRGGNIQSGSWCIKDDDVMIAPEYISKDIYLQRNTFITPAVTSLEHLGKTALIRENHPDIVAGGFVLYLIPYYRDNDLFIEYLSYFFQTAFYNKFCKTITNKSGQAFWNISRQKLMELPIPLPPLSEQHRIVAKIEELFNAIDKIN